MNFSKAYRSVFLVRGIKQITQLDLKTRPDTRQSSRGRFGRSSSLKNARNSKKCDRRTDRHGKFMSRVSATKNQTNKFVELISLFLFWNKSLSYFIILIMGVLPFLFIRNVNGNFDNQVSLCLGLWSRLVLITWLVCLSVCLKPI